MCFFFATVVIHYIGPGKKDTGHWCFDDGYISFEDIKEAYNEFLRFQSKCLEITCDCSYSGKWVSDCRKFLNATNVMGCGHSAAEKGVFMKVKTSSRSDQIPHTLLYSARGWQNTSTGDLFQKYKYEVGQHQNLRYLDNTVVRCKQGLTIKDPCEKNYDWHKQKYLLKNEIEGKPAWQVLLVEDQDQFSGAQILKTGYGEPPEEVVEEIEQCNKVICKPDPCEKNYDWRKEKHLLKLEIKEKLAWQVLLEENQHQLSTSSKAKYGEPPEEVVKEIKQWNTRVCMTTTDDRVSCSLGKGSFLTINK